MTSHLAGDECGLVKTREDGDVATALASAPHVVDATYELPYLAHAPMEPNNAVCRMGEDGILDLWTGTEGPTYERMSASAAGGISQDRIRVHVPQVTEISLDRRNRVRIEKVTFALDCGIVIDPDLVRAQVEGGLVFALGAAAWGEIVLGDGGEILTQSFDRYQVTRMQSVPQIEMILIESGESPTGVGEVSVPTAAPALTNAIFAATGTRIRQLPVSKTMRVL